MTNSDKGENMTTATKPQLRLKGVGMTAACAYELGLDGPNKAEGNDLHEIQVTLRTLIGCHACGIWGDIDPHDVKVNEDALKTGARILSAYTVNDTKIWIISDAAWGDDPLEREVTTILRPEDY
jgi:hypothetical protein